ncbi:MAG: DNA-binding protein [Verrucomicrobiota bacterium]
MIPISARNEWWRHPWRQIRNSKEERQNMIGYDEDKRGSDNYPIHTEKVVTDRKIFFLDLKENDRGQFVKITEDVRGRRDTIMVPAETLDEFIEALQQVKAAADE